MGEYILETKVEEDAFSSWSRSGGVSQDLGCVALGLTQRLWAGTFLPYPCPSPFSVVLSSSSNNLCRTSISLSLPLFAAGTAPVHLSLCQLLLKPLQHLEGQLGYHFPQLMWKLLDQFLRWMWDLVVFSSS